MKLEDYLVEDRDKIMLTKYVEKNKITLLYGGSGSNKIEFIVQHLNKNDIEPGFVGSDNVDKLGSNVRDRVVVVDNWKAFSNKIGGEYKAIDVLKKLIKEYNTTIVLIADMSSRTKNKPDMDIEIYRSIKGRLYIRETDGVLLIDNLRGYTGAKMIELREEPKLKEEY
jgi:hypothetical protein